MIMEGEKSFIDTVMTEYDRADVRAMTELVNGSSEFEVVEGHWKICYSETPFKNCKPAGKDKP